VRRGGKDETIDGMKNNVPSTLYYPITTQYTMPFKVFVNDLNVTISMTKVG
jgi:hypothetical protein